MIDDWDFAARPEHIDHHRYYLMHRDIDDYAKQHDGLITEEMWWWLVFYDYDQSKYADWMESNSDE